MTVIQKQVYESAFNYIGTVLKEAFEKGDKKTKKRVGGYIKCLNQMYMYTNMLETELIVEKLKNEQDTTSGWDQLREKSTFKKNV